MKVSFTQGSVTFTREKDDPKFYGVGHAKGDHAFMHFVKKWLNERGFNLIKKRLTSDGHLMGDEFQPYLCSKDGKDTEAPHIYLYNGDWQIRGANEDWNKGEAILQMAGNVFDKQPDWWKKLQSLGRAYGFATSK